ncbi:MAG: tyrosine-type recombinase/integrase, partial [Mycobacterium sp.]
VGIEDMARFVAWLRAPAPNVVVLADGAGVRRPATVNRYLAGVFGFYDHHARSGLGVAAELVAWRRVSRGSYKPFMHHVTKGRPIPVRPVKLHVPCQAPRTLEPGQIVAVLAATEHLRDRFLLSLLAETGIGEALGLRREDMHLLPDSRSLGCAVVGAHVHVRRRSNPNGSLAKSRSPRVVPASNNVLGAYGDYQVERSAIVGADGCDMVLVNLYHQPLGQPTSYRAVKDFFDRLARSCGFPVRPHMMRHTAATNWVRAGVDVDVVRALLGQVSLASTTVYLHARDEDLRRAVETVAAGRTWR